MYQAGRASTFISSVAQLAGDSGIAGLIFPAFKNADCKPRLMTSLAQFLSTFEFGEGAAFAAWFFEQAKRPIVAMGVPVTTQSTITAVTLTGLSSTSVVTVAATANDHCRAETHGIVRVLSGGTVGTNQIVLEVSLDGGERFIPLRLGKANSLVIPYYGLSLAFAAGTLVAGEVVCKWSSTAPLASISADLDDCMTALAASPYLVRSILYLNDVTTLVDSQSLASAADSYASNVDRYTLFRANTKDLTNEADYFAYAAAMADLFETLDDKSRIDLGIGRCFIPCPITKYVHTRPVQWAVMVEEYRRPIGIATFDASKGKLKNVSLVGPSTKTKMFDERTVKLASPNRFTSLCTDAGDSTGGVFVTFSLTRAKDTDVLSLTHNMVVTNLCQTVCQAATSIFRGTTPEVNADGTPTKKACKFYEDGVNAMLKEALRLDKKDPIVSSASWEADPTSIVKGSGSKLKGVMHLLVRGTVIDIETNIVVG